MTGHPEVTSLHHLWAVSRESAADAVLTVQSGDALGFNLRSSLKSALSSTPTFPGGSSRKQVQFWRLQQSGETSKVSLQTGSHNSEMTTAEGVQCCMQIALLLTIFNLLSFNEVSPALQGKLVAAGGGAMLFFSLFHFQKLSWVPEKPASLSGGKGEGARWK